MQRLAPVEEENFRQAESLLEQWRRKNKVEREEMQALYRKLGKPMDLVN